MFSHGSSLFTSGVLLLSSVVPAGVGTGIYAESSAVVQEDLAQSITWGICKKDVMPGTECGSLSVPVDYSAQGKGANRFNLKVYRLKAADQSAKRGTIMNFPSGPGASGDEGFATIRQFTQEYDLIGADLRGTGLSGPLECSTEDILKIPYIPPTDSVAMNKLVENQRSFWSTCRTQPENLKGNLDAFSNAKDAESIRKALGLGKISLYGFSYGTLTAQRYLGLFGGNVSSSILEGGMNPNQSRREFVMTAAAGVETIYGQFDQWCQQSSECVLQGQDITEVFAMARENAKKGMISGTLFGVPWSEPMVTRFFEVSAGTDQFILAATGLHDLASGRNPIPDDGPNEPDASSIAYADPIVCSDFPMAVSSIEESRADLAASRKAAPVTRYSTNSSNYSSICIGGPGPVPGSSAPVASRSMHPTLLLSNSFDPATPKVWAESVKTQLGSKAVSVVSDQVGHGGAQQHPTTKQKVIDYLKETSD